MSVLQADLVEVLLNKLQEVEVSRLVDISSKSSHCINLTFQRTKKYSEITFEPTTMVGCDRR